MPIPEQPLPPYALLRPCARDACLCDTARNTDEILMALRCFEMRIALLERLQAEYETLASK